MAALAGVMMKLSGHPVVRGMIRGVQPAIFVMILGFGDDSYKVDYLNS